MSKNLGTDVSKTRFRLTKDYKALKDEDFKYSPQRGQKVYVALCSKCHGGNGLGSTNFPSLVEAPLVVGKQSSLIKLSLFGLKGKILRGENTYNGIMPGFKNIPHADLAHALTYVRKSFGKKSDAISTLEIVKGKIDYIEQKGPYGANSL